jgi:hypothetical protein
MKVFEKINILEIIYRHIATLTNVSTKKHEGSDYLLFLFFPISVVLALFYFNLLLTKDFVNILCTCLSIFVGLFFNVIVLIFDLVNKSEKESLKNDLLKELLINISFEIFISVFCILFSIIALVDNVIISKIANGITFFLTALFFINLLMILKRTFELFIKEFEGSENFVSKY